MNYMPNKSVTANNEEEITSIQITGAICKIMSPDKETDNKCSDLAERALVGEISANEQEKSSKDLLKSKGITIK